MVTFQICFDDVTERFPGGNGMGYDEKRGIEGCYNLAMTQEGGRAGFGKEVGSLVLSMLSLRCSLNIQMGTLFVY